jgi:hypothetical protein
VYSREQGFQPPKRTQRLASGVTRQAHIGAKIRTIPDGNDGSPHEVITSITHREKWVRTKDGWVGKRVEEIEQGPTYLDGEPYNPR